MALKLKPTFIEVDRNISNITIKDLTGLYIPNYNDTGYGLPNININNISKVIFQLSLLDSNFIYQYEETDYNKIIYSKDIIISPKDLFNSNNFDQFRDGVYDLNQYVFENELILINTYSIGSIFIVTPTTFTKQYLNKFDCVIDQSGNIYNIDKTKPFDPNIIYLVEEIKGIITNLKLGYRANIKFIISSNIDEKIIKEAISCRCDCDDNMINMYFNKFAAIEAFNQKDYITANNLLLLNSC